MTLLRLEVLRYTRTRRWIPLLAVFVIFGLGGPVLAKYLPELVKNQTGDNITIIVSKPRPVDGVALFASNAGQLGLLVTLVVAAGVLAVDANARLSAFYRTRVRPFDRVILARYAVTAAAVSMSYLLGALSAWYETTVVLGHVNPGRYLVGIAFTVVYLWFAVAIVALAASLARSVAGTAAAAIAFLLGLPILGSLEVLRPWLPSTLLHAQVAMARTNPVSDYLAAAVVAMAAAATAIVVALLRFRSREIA
jgi:ABC-2 type transport system permease protein